MGVIPSGQENHSGAENLNFPGGELNVIFFFLNLLFYRAIFLSEKKNKDIYIYIRTVTPHSHHISGTIQSM